MQGDIDYFIQFTTRCVHKRGISPWRRWEEIFFDAQQMVESLFPQRPVSSAVRSLSKDHRIKLAEAVNNLICFEKNCE